MQPGLPVLHLVLPKVTHRPLHSPPGSRGSLQIVCCSGARSTITADLSRVEEQGVANLARAFLDAQVGRAGGGGRAQGQGSSCLPVGWANS